MVMIVITVIVTALIIAIEVIQTARKKKRQQVKKRDLKEVMQTKHLSHIVASFLSEIVLSVLLVALVWMLYFLAIVITEHKEAAYAMDVTTVIVGVVTVFSALIAFYEFKQRK
ncbi:hypothetical protein [Listeria sp. PSOL-1]|uniref:hypothetical protein n=1 Tax=Listeria sp. PSOL-1 TaxID=1844999 RepID=UPI0013D35A88|nr:hypothetical protein [Listeria sp. PSOL-1]